MTPLIYGKGSCDDFILFDEGFFFFSKRTTDFQGLIGIFCTGFVQNIPIKWKNLIA